MAKKITALCLVALTVLSLAACMGEDNSAQVEGLGYEQISCDEAKEIMDTQKGYVIVDARTQEEYDSGHIKNAILIPDYEISEKAKDELPDKEQLILVYCRSGRRSKNASAQLVELGYTNVKEFGGIIDWKYEIVK